MTRIGTKRTSAKQYEGWVPFELPDCQLKDYWYHNNLNPPNPGPLDPKEVIYRGKPPAHATYRTYDERDYLFIWNEPFQAQFEIISHYSGRSSSCITLKKVRQTRNQHGPYKRFYRHD